MRILPALLLVTATVCAAPTVLAAKTFFDASLNDLDGKKQSLAKYRGKPLVVNYWATWCSPCREEIPEFVALAKKYGKVQFVGIAIDDAKVVGQFARDYKINYPLLADETDAFTLIQQEGNQSGGLPYTVIYDSQGNKVSTKLGRMKGEVLEAVLKTLK
ncbi:Thiol-disulfide isomerase or thioredoxin [Andreprevotia lacus DSM 23236]|jgi:thiol-disulfide isomerase/thioredoxin|uniref:Thiol-disulfide isomerase or thioredoxin n=1 Tax=Andreprevotia lacus DSM 23236 TaxID=1121001 RepID=A0A1W1XKL1_9NEIS|nr:TlpA disulfide reductase family protein [Andreprevotia lacus]SMC24455.1 Thiol-disulfide isomerase or thioredoxin [Andreprevotia lacus DSM 23236]